VRFIFAFLFVAACSLPVFSQQTGPAQQGGVSYDLWRVRSQTITEDLIKDAPDLTSSGRALLWARLAQRWWRDDPEKAHSWMLKPIEMVESIPNKENALERNQRLATTRLLLKIVAPLDQELSQRLVKVLSDDAEHMADDERGANADGLIEAAISIVDKDPQRASQLGALALRTGRPTKIAWLISRLLPKEARLGDALFAQTIEAVRQSLDHELLNSLREVAFPGSIQPGANTATLRDDLRTELLRVDVAYLQASLINAENRSSICVSIASFIVPVMAEFDRRLPQLAGIVRQSVNQCQSLSPLAQQRVDDALSSQPPKTVDDLLKAADASQDVKVRTVYQFRAALLAKEKNDFDRALEILDSMSTESRKFSGGTWEAYRWDWAATSALRHLKTADVYGMRLVINAVPTDLQPFAKMAFVSRLPPNRNKETDPTLEFLNDVRIVLGRSSLSNDEKTGAYLGLLPLTLKYQPSEAIAVLKEAVATLNRADQAKDKDTENSESSSLSGSEVARALPASLLEMDEFAVKDAVASITSPATRVQVRLELLGVCLQRMRGSQQPRANTRPASKGE
jgi:hypothetical protein